MGIGYASYQDPKLRPPEDEGTDACGDCAYYREAAVRAPGGGEHEQAESRHDPGFSYRVGETVEVEDFCGDRLQECAPGIHFFLTPEEAWAY